MDFFLFYYYGDYLMLIMIEFFKERKKESMGIFCFYVEKVLVCILYIRYFKVNRMFLLMNMFYCVKVGI